MGRVVIVALAIGVIVGLVSVSILKLLGLEWNSLLSPLLFGVIGGAITVFLQRKTPKNKG